MRNVAILRDGYSDFLVVRKFIKCILNSHKGEIIEDKSFIDLEQLNITNPLVKYIDKVSRSKDYSYHSEEANILTKELIAIYFACYSRFQREFDVITNKEVIVINADSEKLLIERGNYFSIWAYNIKGLLLFSIEKFYEEMIKQGYNFEYLPFIVPLILYPSSEILIASCMYNITDENLRQLKPTPSLKVKVYGTDSIPEAIQSGILELTLDTHMTNESLNEIYREIPEARLLMHSLAI